MSAVAEPQELTDDAPVIKVEGKAVRVRFAPSPTGDEHVHALLPVELKLTALSHS